MSSRLAAAVCSHPSQPAGLNRFRHLTQNTQEVGDTTKSWPDCATLREDPDDYAIARCVDRNLTKINPESRRQGVIIGSLNILQDNGKLYPKFDPEALVGLFVNDDEKAQVEIRMVHVSKDRRIPFDYETYPVTDPDSYPPAAVAMSTVFDYRLVDRINWYPYWKRVLLHQGIEALKNQIGRSYIQVRRRGEWVDR